MRMLRIILRNIRVIFIPTKASPQFYGAGGEYYLYHSFFIRVISIIRIKFVLLLHYYICCLLMKLKSALF